MSVFSMLWQNLWRVNFQSLEWVQGDEDVSNIGVYLKFFIAPLKMCDYSFLRKKTNQELCIINDIRCFTADIFKHFLMRPTSQVYREHVNKTKECLLNHYAVIITVKFLNSIWSKFPGLAQIFKTSLRFL